MSEPNIFNPKMKLLSHSYKISQWLNSELMFPILIEISLSNACNQNCSYCFYKNMHDATHINTEKLKMALVEMSTMGVKAVTYTGGGEPTMHPDFNEIVEYTYKLGLKQGLFTNGTNDIKHPEYFEWIRISVSESELHIKHAPKWVKKTMVGACMTVTKNNWEKARYFRAQTENVGLAYFQFRPALLKDQEDIDITFDDFYAFVKEDAKITIIPSKYKWDKYLSCRNYDKCYGYNFCPFIDSNGDLLTCAYHLKDPNYIFGNIYETNFGVIWANKTTPIINLDNCQACCKNHEINELLYDLKHLDLKHRDFI